MTNLGRYIYLARHGQTQWNLQHRRQGQLDSPLTHTGVQQALQLAALLADRNIDAIFVSPLGRALTTAEIIAQAVRAPVVILDELAEVHHGQFAGLTNDQIRAAYPGSLEARAANKYRWQFPGGESYADVDNRSALALDRMEGTLSLRPLIISHEMIGRMLLRRLLGLSPEDALSRDHPHDIVYRVDTFTAELMPLSLPGKESSS